MSKKRNADRNRLAYYTGYVVCFASALLWIVRKRLDLDVSTLMIFTGMAMIILIALFNNRKREKENQRTSEELKQMHEEMTSDIFDEKKY
jgi:hypothetical protein